MTHFKRGFSLFGAVPLQITVQVAATLSWSGESLARHGMACHGTVWHAHSHTQHFALVHLCHYSALFLPPWLYLTGASLRRSPGVAGTSLICRLCETHRVRSWRRPAFGSLAGFVWCLARGLTLSVNEIDASHYGIKCQWLYSLRNRIVYQVPCYQAAGGFRPVPSVHRAYVSLSSFPPFWDGRWWRNTPGPCWYLLFSKSKNISPFCAHIFILPPSI